MLKNSGARRLGRNDLTARCDARVFGKLVAPFTALINQGRAIESLTFGLRQEADGYHILAEDPLGHGRRSALRQTVAEIVTKYWPPAELFDYCYVERPQDVGHPRLLILPAGAAKNLRERVGKAFSESHKEALAYFRGMAWEKHCENLQEDTYKEIYAKGEELNEFFRKNNYPCLVLDIQNQQGFNWLPCVQTIVSLNDWMLYAKNPQEKEARSATAEHARSMFKSFLEKNPQPNEQDLANLNDDFAQLNMLVAAIKYGGEPLLIARSEVPPKLWLERAQNDQERIVRKQVTDMLMEKHYELVQACHEIFRRLNEQMVQDRDDKIGEVVRNHLAGVPQEYPPAQDYCADLLACVAKHPIAFFPPELIDAQSPEEAQMTRERVKRAFTVHVVLAREPGSTTPPIVQPDDHSYETLFPTVRPAYHMGGLVFDLTKITSGAMLEANGGVLIIDGRALFDVLRTPTGVLAYGKLTDSLKSKKLVPEMLGQRHGGVMGEMLEPDPIPLNVKVILAVGTNLYAALNEGDQDTVADLFRVTAQFAPTTERTPETERQYAGFVENQGKTLGLRPFTAPAFARIVEYGSRLEGHKARLSLDMGKIKKLAIEASYYAADTTGAKSVRRAHVERALQEQHRRVSLLTSERMLEVIRDGTILITVQGRQIGRANGLAVLDAAGLMFGVPSTITANSWQNDAFELSFIDRSADMTGKIFNKAVETTASIIQARYGQEDAIPFAVRVSFEQVYDLIDGDSASVIGTCIALSALGGIPLRQDIACTGSLNQNGEVQPIGGSNEKMEGFFDVCQVLGPAKGQGVLVPEANVQNLVLRGDVVHACQKGIYSVWGYSRWEDAMELLSGMPMGDVDTRIRERIAEVNEKKKQEMLKLADTSPAKRRSKKNH